MGQQKLLHVSGEKMGLFLEILGALYLLVFGLRVCITLGHTYEAMRDIIDEDPEDWKRQTFREKLLAFLLCAISQWFILPIMWTGDLVKGID